LLENLSTACRGSVCVAAVEKQVHHSATSFGKVVRGMVNTLPPLSRSVGRGAGGEGNNTPLPKFGRGAGGEG